MANDKEKLKQFMIQHNLKQSQLAEKINIKQQVISRLLNDEKQVEATPALKYGLLKYYQYDIESDCYTNKSEGKYQTETVPIPFYEVKAAAGKGCENVEYPEKDVVYFDKRWLKSAIGRNPEHLSLIIADGDSMIPDIQSGDLLMVDDTIKEVIPNKIFIIKQEGKNRVKKLKRDINGKIYIVSNNPIYEPEPIKQETIIIGQVVWNGSKENV